MNRDGVKIGMRPQDMLPRQPAGQHLLLLLLPLLGVP
jgi:hypothetical protein